MTIDWERFAARVPAGTIVNAWGMDGLLISFRPHFESPSFNINGTARRGSELHFQPFMRLAGKYVVVSVFDLIFLIDNRWLTFAEVMAAPTRAPDDALTPTDCV